MIQLLRYGVLLLKQPWKIRKDPLAVSRAQFRVMPWDCDLNLHLTNTRYPSFMDLARVQYLFEIGMVPLAFKDGWRPIVSSQTMTFIKEIKPLAAVSVESRVLHWDRKYFYHEHRFLVDGEVHARALGRMTLIRNGRIKSFDSLLMAIDAYYKRPPIEYQTPEASREVIAIMELLNAKRAVEESIN